MLIVTKWLNADSDTTAHRPKVGSSVEIALQQYQHAENVEFFKRNSVTIEKAKLRMPDVKLKNYGMRLLKLVSSKE